MRDTSSMVRVGFVGAGYMAREHARAFSGLASLVGVVSRDAGNANRFGRDFDIELSTSSINEFFRKASPDVVIIAVPELELPSVLKQCFRHPALFLVEKPIGVNLEVSRAMTILAQDQAARAFVALNRRHYSSTRNLLEGLADQQDVGRLIQVLDQEDQVAARHAGQPEEVVRHWMFANSIHVVDLIMLIGRGDVASVNVVDAWNPQAPGFVSGNVLFGGGDKATYQAVWNAPGPWSCSVTTPTTRYEMRPIEQLWLQERGTRYAKSVPLDHLDQKFKPGLRKQAEQTVRAVQGLNHCLPTFEDSLASMNLVAALYGLADR